MTGRLSEEEADTYSRQMGLEDIGSVGQLRIRKARALVVGIGGLGSTILTQLAGMGVGLLRIVDRDIVERANLHRQGIFDIRSLGMPKVEAAEDRVAAMNPDVKVEALTLSVNQTNVRSLVNGVDVVLDGLDSVASRRHVNKACVELGIPYVFGSAIEMFGNVSTVIPRKTPCLDCFFPREAEPTATCATVGVHPSLVSIVASVEVSEAIRIMTGVTPSLEDKLLFIDLRSMAFDQVDIRRSDLCRTCGQGEAPCQQVISEGFVVEQACSTRGKTTYIVSPNGKLDLDLRGQLPTGLAGFAEMKARYRLGVALLHRNGTEINLLKSGVGIIRGAKDRSDALRSYTDALHSFRPS